MLRTLCIAIASLCATLLAGELLLRLLPVSTATMTGYYGDPDLLVYPAGHSWTVSAGWDLRHPHTLHANNAGFASDTDFVPNPAALALIGDSYVESSALLPQDRPAAQLQAQLQPRPVYGLGSPGTALLDYAQRVRWARQTLHTTDFVLWLEAGDVRQSLCGSGNVHSRCLDPQTLAPRTERMAAPGLLKRWARHSALAQYVFGQLKVSGDSLRAAVLPAPVATPAHTADLQPGSAARLRSEAMVTAVVNTFFAEVQPYVQGRLLVMVDGRRTGIDAAPNLLTLERRVLIAQLRAHGAEVIDLEPVYAQHAAQSPAPGLSLQVSPNDQHLNALGVGLVTAAAAQVLIKCTATAYPTSTRCY